MYKQNHDLVQFAHVTVKLKFMANVGQIRYKFLDLCLNIHIFISDYVNGKGTRTRRTTGAKGIYS